MASQPLSVQPVLSTEAGFGLGETMLNFPRCIPSIIGAALAMIAIQPASAASSCPTHFASGIEPALVNPKLARAATELCSQRFVVLHSAVTRTPLYVAEHLTRAGIAAARDHDQRDNRFHADSRLRPADRSELADYVRSGFDRGHMAPSGDMTDEKSDYESFGLANTVPQVGALNRNSWADMESYVRTLTTNLGDAYVVTGPAYEDKNVKALNGRVLVPTSTWKAMYVPGQGAGAWIATNTATPRWKVISIVELSRRTGIDPFPRLDAATKAKVPTFPNFGRDRAKRDR